MNTQDIIHILCRLKHNVSDFETIQSSFVYEFSGRKYEILLKRIDGKLLEFQILDAGEVVNEEN